MVYVGNATYTGTNAFNFVDSIPAAVKIYTITAPFRPIAFLQLTNESFRVESVVSAGSGVWHVRVSGDSFTNPPVIKCFCRLSGPGTNNAHGFRVFNGSGLRTWDSNEPMLVWTQKNTWASASTSGNSPLADTISASGFTSPCIYAAPGGRRQTSVQNAGGSLYTIREFTAGFRVNAGLIERFAGATQIQQYTEDASFPILNRLNGGTSYLIDAVTYP
jgi:hypothetical protein